MTFDYGTLYNINTSDPFNTDVYMSWLASGTMVINKTDTPTPLPAFFYLEDNDTIQEATYISRSGGNDHLFVNLVSGTTAIYRSDLIDVEPCLSYTVIGIKKVTTTLYSVYCLDTSASTSTEIVLDFRKVIGTSGSASSDTSIQDIRITIESGAIWGSTQSIIGRSLYLSVFYQVDAGQGREFKLYRLDMDTENFSEIGSHSLPATTDVSYSSINGIVNFIGVLEDKGEVKWWIDYFKVITDPVFPNPQHFINYVYFDGAITNVFEVDPYSSSLHSNPLNRNLYKYNYQDTKIARSFTYDGTTYYLVIDSISGVSIQTSNTTFPDAVPVSFVSKAVFPKIGISGSTFYWLDSNGKIDTAITFTGVTSITDIFPTLDTVNGNFYMNAHMADGTDKIVAVDPTTRAITYIFDLPNFPYTTAPNALANHGKFFISNKITFSTRSVISYVVDMPDIPKANDVQSILEMN